jgi:transcription initiation factor TFIIIB Brf1 subunit/transcription initiation factor TFIIB
MGNNLNTFIYQRKKTVEKMALQAWKRRGLNQGARSQRRQEGKDDRDGLIFLMVQTALRHLSITKSVAVRSVILLASSLLQNAWYGRNMRHCLHRCL